MKVTQMHKQCQWCGETFYGTVKEGQKSFLGRKFCSKECSNLYWAGKRAKPIEDRFWEKVSVNQDPKKCWAWRGVKDQHGYGRLHLDEDTKHAVKAHRFSWELHKGPIPKGLVAMHICDNPNCVNPAHIKIGSQKQNAMDMSKKNRINPKSLGNLIHGNHKTQTTHKPTENENAISQ